MRLLLDENLPRKLRWRFGSGHQVSTVQEMGWNGYKNDELLRVAEKEFEVLITADQRMSFQNAIARLKAVGNEYEQLLPLIPGVLRALNHIQPGQVIFISL